MLFTILTAVSPPIIIIPEILNLSTISEATFPIKDKIFSAISPRLTLRFFANRRIFETSSLDSADATITSLPAEKAVLTSLITLFTSLRYLLLSARIPEKFGLTTFMLSISFAF